MKLTLTNEYLTKACNEFGADWSTWQRLDSNQWRCREVWTRMYAWAIPNDDALELCAAHGPIVEIGAGTGYWAMLLRKMGVDVIAYDISPPVADAAKNDFHPHVAPWTIVLQGGPEKVCAHPDRTLMLCWPPFDEPMASDCLANYTGSTLIYIGEDADGCTGDALFHEMIEYDWIAQAQQPIPKYAGIYDTITVYQRT